MSIMLTRAAARAIRCVPLSSVCAKVTHLPVVVSWSRRQSINKLPDDVLLEVFDAYRLDLQRQPRYEYVWNSRDGWFKLAHVCLRWRLVVLSSSSRLHLHLLFTPWRPSKVHMLRRLPQFPVIVDYTASPWTEREENLAVAAIGTGSRVHRLALRRSYANMAKLLRALDRPFPELESLEIFPIHGRNPYSLSPLQLTLPPKFISTSAPRLTRLALRDVHPECLAPLLSSATGLIDLNLDIWYSATPETSLLTDLKRMSCLHRLELRLTYRNRDVSLDSGPPPPVGALAGDIVSLSKLTHLIFGGHASHLEALVAGLAAPSLQHLEAGLIGQFSTFPIPHLCRFISEAECRFIAVRLDFSSQELKLSAETSSNLVRDQPFKLVIPGHSQAVSLEEMGNRLSQPLSTVEELVVVLLVPWPTPPFSQWHRFFSHIQQVKVVRVPSFLARRIARSLQDGQVPSLDLLPALEQIEVDMVMVPSFLSNGSDDDSYATINDAFMPFIDARRRAGRPIRLSWI